MLEKLGQNSAYTHWAYLAIILAAHMEVLLRHANGSRTQFVLHHGDKAFIVGNQCELKIRLFRPGSNDSSQRNSKPPFVVFIEIYSRLVQNLTR